MISKEEYVRLYCDELLYKTSKVMAVDRDKVAHRMAINPLKTIEDLDDYGINDIDFGVAIAGANGVKPLNRKAMEQFEDRVHGMNSRELDKLHDMLFSDEEMSWGSEDSIR